MPDLRVHASEGRPLALSTLIGSPSTLLNFMHDTWCPECVNQLRSLQRHEHAIAATGTRIVVIMVDVSAHVAAFQLRPNRLWPTPSRLIQMVPLIAKLGRVTIRR